MADRFALLTVDTEALPKRSTINSVNNLIWGMFGANRAGVQEISSIGNEFSIKHIFFIDFCSSYDDLPKIMEVVSFLDNLGEDIQLHAHPETLPENFWFDNSVSLSSSLPADYFSFDQYVALIKSFSGLIESCTNSKVRAFRSGSFRWNADLIRALEISNCKLSFNNTMKSFVSGKCTYSEPTNYPFLWSNGVIEIPLTERLIPPQPGGKPFWASFTYPESPYFPYQKERKPFCSIFDAKPEFKVLLMHSWSFLDFDENGHVYYKDDQRLEGYRKLLSRMTKDYDVITTQDFLDLYERGKIPITRTVDLAHAELKR